MNNDAPPQIQSVPTTNHQAKRVKNHSSIKKKRTPIPLENSYTVSVNPQAFKFTKKGHTSLYHFVLPPHPGIHPYS